MMKTPKIPAVLAPKMALEEPRMEELMALDPPTQLTMDSVEELLESWQPDVQEPALNELQDMPAAAGEGQALLNPSLLSFLGLSSTPSEIANPRAAAKAAMAAAGV